MVAVVVDPFAKQLVDLQRPDIGVQPGELEVGRAEATDELDAYMRAYYGVPADVMARAQACHAGTLESVAEWFAAYADAGARHMVVRLARPGLVDYNDTVKDVLGAARLVTKA